MPIPSFTAGYPPDNTSLGQTKTTIRNNIDGTFQTLAINHYNNNQTEAGKHKYIQLPKNNDPGGSTEANEILLTNQSSTLGGTSNLFFTTYNKVISGNSVQLTRTEIPSTGNNGFTWMAGGIIIQWGFVQTPLSNGLTGTVNFNTTFDVKCLNVTTSPYYDSGAVPNGGADVVVESDASFPNTTQFKWKAFTNSGSYTGFYWFAIGK